MQTEDAYSSGHLVLSLLGFAYVLHVETSDLNQSDIAPVCDVLPDLCLQDFTIYQIKVSIEHMQQVWHANRGRLLLRTPGPVSLWDLHVF